MTGERGDARGGETPSGEHRDVPEEDVFTSREEGAAYRGSSYMPTAYDNLDVAPAADAYPDRGDGGDGRRGDSGGYRLLDLPRVPKLSHVVGPSAILLGASLGSGETLFWPLLVARRGWDLYWLFVVGVLTQFFINTEIQRWTVATGESVFRGFERVSPGWPLLFLVLGLVSLGWPGWAASAAKIGTAGVGLDAASLRAASAGSIALSIPAWRVVGVVLLVLIWLTYQVTPLMYNVVERVQIVLVSFALVAAVVLFLALGSAGELANAPMGLLDAGGLPPDADVALVLGGVAFAGAGGYLNLTQSLWVREKGYGMGRYQGRVKNPVVGDEPEPVRRDGFTFPPTVTNLRRWRGWWRLIQLEHLLTFVVGLLVAATMLMALAGEYAAGTTADGVAMWTTVVVPQVGPLASALVFAILFLALLTTEYAIVESFVRNSADVIYELYGRRAGWSLPRLFWGLLTLFVLWGIGILALPLPIPVEQPFGLLVVGAALSGVMMWPYTALLAVVNATRLPEHTQPGWARLASLWWGSSFFAYFTVLLAGSWLAGSLGLDAFATSVRVAGSEPGGYLLFAVAGLLQASVVLVSARGKRRTEETVEDAGQARGFLY
ncbi:MAG: Nramp family divalent metal transporter [Haloarculaceae archaeon]